jgi:L-amino acid N-acyltransferase YncA
MAGARIRVADEADAARMLAIYAPYVRDTAISFEVDPPSEEEFRRRVRSARDFGCWLVCEAGEEALGYAYAGRFHARAAYQWTAEVTVYVHRDRCRQGVGRGLYTALVAGLRLQGFRSAIGVIALPNPPSVGLHEQMGFTPAGVVRAVGYKHGRWHDVGWWQRDLADAGPPAGPPRSLAAVQGTPGWRDALAAGAALVRM